MFLSKDGLCTLITRLSSTEEITLSSNQKEEADTKVIMHCDYALRSNGGRNVFLCSPSGDTDIIVLTIALLKEYENCLFIENGSGGSKRRYWLKDF